MVERSGYSKNVTITKMDKRLIALILEFLGLSPIIVYLRETLILTEGGLASKRGSQFNLWLLFSFKAFFF